MVKGQESTGGFQTKRLLKGQEYTRSNDGEEEWPTLEKAAKITVMNNQEELLLDPEHVKCH